MVRFYRERRFARFRGLVGPCWQTSLIVVFGARCGGRGIGVSHFFLLRIPAGVSDWGPTRRLACRPRGRAARELPGGRAMQVDHPWPAHLSPTTTRPP